MNPRMQAPYALALCAVAVFLVIELGNAGGQTSQSWIDGEVAAIATAVEKREFTRLSADAERARFQEIFWLRRDPDLSTPDNEFREAYERRIELADERLTGPFGPGSRTDMGYVFLLFGFPASVSYSRDPVGSDPDAGRPKEVGELLEGSFTEGGLSDEGAMPRRQHWEYAADSSVGLESGLVVSFRARPGLGYRLASDDAFEQIAESRRMLLVHNPDIGYEFGPEGRLLPAVVPDGPRAAGEVLGTLVATKSPSGSIGLSAHPAYFRSRPGTTYVAMLMQLGEGSVSFDTGRADLTFFGAFENADGELVGRFVERVSLLPGATPRLEMPLQLAPGAYTAHLGVVDSTRDAHGARIVAIRVPGFGADGLQLSSVVIYRTAEQADGLAGIPGRAFQFGMTKFDPVGSRALSAEDSLGIFYNVYGVAGADVSARYVFFRNGVEHAQTRPQPLVATNGVAFESSEIPLASFTAGDYEIVVQVVDATTDETVQSSRVRFTLR